MDAWWLLCESVRTAEVARNERGSSIMARIFRKDDRLAWEKEAEAGHRTVEPAHKEILVGVVRADNATPAIGTVEDEGT